MATDTQEKVTRFVSTKKSTIQFNFPAQKGQHFNPYKIEFEQVNVSGDIHKPKIGCQLFVRPSDVLSEAAGPKLAGKPLIEYLKSKPSFGKKPEKREFWVDEKFEKEEKMRILEQENMQLKEENKMLKEEKE